MPLCDLHQNMFSFMVGRDTGIDSDGLLIIRYLCVTQSLAEATLGFFTVVCLVTFLFQEPAVFYF